MKKERKSALPASLREKALLIVKNKSISPYFADTDEKAQDLILELELHQIELELQNEELRMTQEKARMEADRFIEMYDFAPFGFFELSENGEIIGLNLRGANLLGCNRSSLKKSRFGFFVSEKSKPIFNRFLENLFSKRAKQTCELTLTSKDNESISVFLSGIILENKQRCNVNVFDITQTKIAQNLLIANKELAFQNEEKEKRAAELVIANKELAFQNEEKEKRAAELVIANKELAFQNEEKEKRATELIIAKNKAQENDRLKSAFLANMSHEIRTPMNAILGFADLLKDPDTTVDQQQKYVTLIEKGGLRMLNLINDLIDVSRIESGQIELILSKCNIKEQVEFIYNLFHPEVERKGMRMFIYSGITEDESIVIADQEKIYAILTNLVKNAIKYSNTGSIEIGYQLINKNSQTELMLYVKDTGIGISTDNFESIFNRFAQVDLKHNIYVDGVGLGLSIIKGYVAVMGGKIWVESELRKGSTFYVTFPYKNVAYASKGELSDETILLQAHLNIKLKILIVEDDQSSVILQTELVRKHSKATLCAGSGIEAVEMFKMNPDIDLIMMDISLPKMSGYEATRQIREMSKKVIIIAQTAHVFNYDRNNAMKAGCNEFITKPLDRFFLQKILVKYFN